VDDVPSDDGMIKILGSLGGWPQTGFEEIGARAAILAIAFPPSGLRVHVFEPNDVFPYRPPSLCTNFPSPFLSSSGK